MPYKDEQTRREYIREYMKKYRKNPHSGETQIYDQPPILSDEDIEEMKEGLSRKELNELNQTIADAMSEPDPEELEEYNQLDAKARKRI
ncbi:MAG TPA: hypothetical protein VGB32_07065, partial [Candidatus Bathyarchaeia archaeon]